MISDRDRALARRLFSVLETIDLDSGEVRESVAQLRRIAAIDGISLAELARLDDDQDIKINLTSDEYDDQIRLQDLAGVIRRLSPMAPFDEDLLRLVTALSGNGSISVKDLCAGLAALHDPLVNLCTYLLRVTEERKRIKPDLTDLIGQKQSLIDRLNIPSAPKSWWSTRR